MTTKLYIISSYLRILFRQLYLSVTSVDFYYDVYKYYKGYGMKYLFAISFISSVIYSISLLNNIAIIKEYFLENKISKYTENIELLLKQLPILYYDGNNISIKEETPFYLYSSNDNVIAAIDTKNQLTPSEKLKIPIVFTSDKIHISLNEGSYAKKSNNIHRSVDYHILFGIERNNFNYESIKKQFGNILGQLETIVIYIVTPILAIGIFIFRLLENILIIMPVYLLTYSFGPISSIETCVRIVIFSSGVRSLLHIIFMAFFPQFVEFVWYVQIWTCFLMVKAILKLRG